MGNSHSQQDILQRAVVGKKSGSRKKADTYHKVIIESKSVDGNLNRIVKSRPENEDHGPISNLARTPFNAFPDPDPKQPQAIKMVPAVKEVQSEPFILHHQTNASSNIIEIQDSSSHRILLNYESSDQPLSDSQKVKQTPSTTESILALQDYSPDSVDLDASLNQFSSKKSQSDGMGTPVIRRAGVRNMQKVDVPALIEASRSGDILPSQPRTNYNSRDKIVNDSMEVFDTNRSADGSQNSVAVMSSMSLSLMHRWSACDPHVYVLDFFFI